MTITNLEKLRMNATRRNDGWRPDEPNQHSLCSYQRCPVIMSRKRMVRQDIPFGSVNRRNVRYSATNAVWPERCTRNAPDVSRETTGGARRKRRSRAPIQQAKTNSLCPKHDRFQAAGGTRHTIGKSRGINGIQRRHQRHHAVNVCPTLQQPLYVEVEFWRKFQLAPEILGVESIEHAESEFITKSEPVEPHILNPQQQQKLEGVKIEFLA
ncbi:hypothetical protein ACLKA7_000858 [Drosophila subpalustris]